MMASIISLSVCLSFSYSLSLSLSLFLRLPNLGQTCYMNATLQCLFSLRPFCTQLLQQEAIWRQEPSALLLRYVHTHTNTHTYINIHTTHTHTNIQPYCPSLCPPLPLPHSSLVGLFGLRRSTDKDMKRAVLMELKSCVAQSNQQFKGNSQNVRKKHTHAICYMLLL